MVPANAGLHDTDRLIEVLSHRRRRLLCTVLHRGDADAYSLADLTDRVVAREAAARDVAPGRRHRRRVREALHHAHLPKLDSAGLLAYDADDAEVAVDRARLTELFEAVGATAYLEPERW